MRRFIPKERFHVAVLVIEDKAKLSRL